jgi:hypothetical protein
MAETPAPAAPENPADDLDEAHQELQDTYPELDWEGAVNAAVSRALELGFEIGRDFANRHPD